MCSFALEGTLDREGLDLRAYSVIQSLSNMADVVIYDSPPVMAVTDPIILATQVDAVLAVLDAQRARRQTMKHVAQTLQQAGTPVLGAIFNKVPTRGTGYYSYYHYYSYYSDYSENGQHKESN